MQTESAVRRSASGGLPLIWRIRACASRVTGPHDEALGSSRTASVARALEARWAAIRAVRSQSDSVSPLRTRRSEEHTSELQSPCNLVCRLLLEKKKYR